MARLRWLGSDEEVVLSTRRHPAELFAPAFWTGLVVALAAAAGFITGPHSGTDPVDIGAGIVAALALLRLSVRVLRWSSYRLVITDRRLVECSGTLSRRVTSVPLAGVTEVGYRRSVGGRVLGYGELVLAGGPDKAAGARRIERIPHVGACCRELTDVLMGDLHEAQRGWVALDEADTGPLPRVVL